MVDNALAPPGWLAATAGLVGLLGCYYPSCPIFLGRGKCGGVGSLQGLLDKLPCKLVQFGPRWDELAQGCVLAAQVTLRELGRNIRPFGPNTSAPYGLLLAPPGQSRSGAPKGSGVPHAKGCRLYPRRRQLPTPGWAWQAHRISLAIPPPAPLSHWLGSTSAGAAQGSLPGVRTGGRVGEGSPTPPCLGPRPTTSVGKRGLHTPAVVTIPLHGGGDLQGRSPTYSATRWGHAGIPL